MKVHFTRPLHIGEHYFKIGEQEVDDKLLRSGHFAKHIAAGHIIDAATIRKERAAPTPKERADALLEKLHGKDKKDLTPEQAAKAHGGVGGAENAGPADPSAPADPLAGSSGPELPPIEPKDDGADQNESAGKGKNKGGKKN